MHSRRPPRSPQATRCGERIFARHDDGRIKWYPQPTESIPWAGIKPGRFNPTSIKRFKTALGQTPVAYLLHIRMTAAKELLITDLQVPEVARIIGIHDPAYFSRVFHRIKGISQLAYRKRMTRKASVAHAAARGRKLQ